MTYQQTIDFLYHTLPMFSRMGSVALKKDLTNTLLLSEQLGNPHKKLKTIHVGGTNGKGSVSHMLAAIFQNAGYKTGLYTSPHLYDFRERIRVNGIMADKGFVVDFVERIKPAISQINPSFFEITVVMAFDYFARQQVDISIVEVGLGGRLDSTNVITPELSVITNIGWDHMNILGHSLAEIAWEKGGIIKEHVPVVIGEKRSDTDAVFKKIALEKSAPLFFAEDHFFLEAFTMHPHTIEMTIKDSSGITAEYESDLPGIYQTKNLVTVLQAMSLLDHWNISGTLVRAALKNVKELTGLQGRWEVIHTGPLVVLEVAHNKDGVQQMLFHLSRLRYHQLHVVIGVVRDKDVEQLLELLPATAKYYFTQAHIARALEAATLREKANRFGLQGNDFGDVNSAISSALSNASTEDVIIVCGSIFLVAEVDRSLPGLLPERKGK